MVSRLMNFNNVCELKLVITKIFRNQFYKMRPEHFHQLEALFIEYDQDKDGVLGFDEFSRAIASIEELNIDQKHLKAVYQRLAKDGGSADADGNSDEKEKEQIEGAVSSANGIEFGDLLNALVYDYLVSCDERLYDAFRKLDDDNDGKITTQELKDKLRQIDPLGEWDHAMRVIEENSMGKESGVIDYTEFLLYLHPNFEEAAEWMPGLFKEMQSVNFGGDFEHANMRKPVEEAAKNPRGKKKKSKKAKGKKKRAKE